MALGFYFDMTRCVGCRACQIACKDKNRLDVGVILRKAKTYEVGEFPTCKTYSYSFSCNHCETPACMTACPTGAIYKAEDGTVILDQALCDGCGACVQFCPYGHPQMNEEVGIAWKCDACAYLRAKGMNPACVDACPSRALDFGDLDELRAKYGEDLVSDIAILPDSSMTGANILIKAKEIAFDENFTELPM